MLRALDDRVDHRPRREDANLVSDLEESAPGRKRFGQVEAVLLGIIAANRAAVLSDRHELHVDSVHLAEVMHQRAVDIGSVQLRCFFFRCGLELREKVQIELDDVRDFFRGKVRRIDADEIAPVVELR